MTTRWFTAVLLLAFAVAPSWAQTTAISQDAAISVGYQRTISLPFPSATAAYAVNDYYADASAHEGWLTITGKQPGSTTIVVVTSIGVQTLKILVPQPPPVYPPGFDPVSIEARTNQRGSYELRYTSDPAQWQNVFDFAAVSGDRTSRFYLSNVNYFSDGLGEQQSRFGLTNVSYEISTPNRQITLADQVVTNSPLTLDAVMVRGFHLRQKGWEFHGGYSSMASFQNLFLPAEREAVVGLGYRFEISDKVAITPQLYYFDSPHPSATGHTGAMSSVVLRYRPTPKLELSSEVGVSAGAAAATRLEYEGRDGERVRAKLRYQPREFASLSTNGLRGLVSEFDWSRRFSAKWDSQLLFSGSRYFLQGGSQANISLTWSTQYQWSKRWALLSGASVSRFTAPVTGIGDSGLNLQLPIGVAVNLGRLGATAQYRLVHTSGTGELGGGLHLSARASRGGWFVSGYLDRQSNVPTVAAIVSDTPGLQDLLERLGLTAITPQQLANLLQDSAILEALGYVSAVRLDLSLQNLQTGVDAGWVEHGGARQKLNFNFLHNDNQALHSSLRTTIYSATYSRHLGSNNELFGTLSLLRSGTTDLRNHPIAQVSLRHNFSSVPPLLFPTRTGTISGHVYEAPELQARYSPELQPIPQVEVVLDGTQRLRTDRNGRYVFTRVPYGEHQLAVTVNSDRPFYFTTPSHVQVNINETVDFGVTYSLAQLVGTIVNDAGVGLPEVGLQVIPSEGESFKVTTDGSGKFVLRTVPPGTYTVKLLLETLPEGYDLSPQTSQALTLRAGEPAEAHFAMRALRSISGRVQVRDATGATKPLSGWPVRLLEQGRASKTDSEGRYLFRDLAAGQHTVLVSYGGQEQKLSVTLPAEPGFSKGNDFVLPEAKDSGRQPAEAGASPQAASDVQHAPEMASPSASLPEAALQDIFFDFEQHGLRADQRSRLELDAEFLRHHPEVRLQLAGHCDERGSEAFNLQLGYRRAGTVRNALVAAGVAPERLSTASYGKSKLFCRQANRKCQRLNRRVHVTVHDKAAQGAAR